MKIWIKYLIGIALGVLAALILPLDSPQAVAVLDFLTEAVIRIVRYTVIPLVFFSVLTAVFRLDDSKLMLKTALWSVIIIVLSNLILTAVGLVSIVAVHLPRIPISVEKDTAVASIDIKDLFMRLFPYSSFEVFQEGSYLLPVFTLALIAGYGLTTDQNVLKPVITLADALSTLFYNISSFFCEMLAVGMIIIMCDWTVKYRGTISNTVFLPLVLLLFADLLLTALVIYPLILRYLFHDPHPYRAIYAGIAPVLVAFFSGDTNLTLPVAMRHGNESLGIRRRINGFTYPLFSIFARGGSALVITVSFVVIWRSYSSLNMSFSDILWIVGTSFGLSFLLGGLPSGGTFVALTVLCTTYSRGFETGYLLLKPFAPVLCAFAAALDAVTLMYGSYMVASVTKMTEHHDARHFI